jgi:transposase-like protein
MIEEMLKAELEKHLEQSVSTSKNGSYPITVRSNTGELTLNIPRD